MCARAFIPHAVSRMCLPPLRSPGVGPAASSPSRAPRSYQPPPNHVKAAGHVGLWGWVEHTHRSHFGFADFEGTANGNTAPRTKHFIQM